MSHNITFLLRRGCLITKERYDLLLITNLTYVFMDNFSSCFLKNCINSKELILGQLQQSNHKYIQYLNISFLLVLKGEKVIRH